MKPSKYSINSHQWLNQLCVSGIGRLVLLQNSFPIIMLFKVCFPTLLGLMEGLNTNSGQIINIRLRPAKSPDTFYDMETLMDTMLHELVHNVHLEHDKSFYALLEEVTRDW